MGDLENYEFNDDDLSVSYLGDHEVHLDLDCDTNYIIISRDDVIAMAKHFEVTAGELEG